MKIEVKHWTRRGVRFLSVEFKGRTWEHSDRVAEDLRNKPPDGHRLMEHRVRQAGSSGRRNFVRMVFQHNDDRVPPFSTSEAVEWFAEFQQRAMTL